MTNPEDILRGLDLSLVADALRELHPALVTLPAPPLPDLTDAVVALGIPSKPWWRSTTILAAAAVVLSQAIAFAGYSVDAPQILALLTTGVGLVAGVWAIVGRLVATQPIRRA